MSSLFISPHSDDVCLSIGALSKHALSDKLLVTVFSASSWVEPGAGSSGTEAEVTEVREREDREFCSRVGFRYHSLGLADSCVRHEGRGNLRVPTGHERSLEHQATKGLHSLAHRGAARVIVGPLGIGGHTDHVVCRRATLNVAAMLGVPALLYEDLPYANEVSLTRIAARAWSHGLLTPVVCKTRVSAEQKLRLFDTYVTQRNQSIRDAVTSHSARLSARFGTPLDAQEDRVFERVWSTEGARSLRTVLDAPVDVVGSMARGLLGVVAQLDATIGTAHERAATRRTY